MRSVAGEEAKEIGLADDIRMRREIEDLVKLALGVEKTGTKERV